MGYDAFGLPAEQYAIEHNINPAQAVEKNVKTFERQLSIIGLSYDWERRVNTTDPSFYKWTQWIFLKIYNSWYNPEKNKAEPITTLIKIFNKKGNLEARPPSGGLASKFSAKEWKIKSKKEKQDILMKYRLAYEGYAEVNWCKDLGTVLANDEVIEKNGLLVSERGEFPVVKKQMRQWFMRITAYADRLIAGLDEIDWSNSIKEIERNWIGKSEGSEIEFALVGAREEELGKISVFTTRADTLFGVTYVVLAPEHELVKKISDSVKNLKEVSAYVNKVTGLTEQDRVSDEKEKTGIELKGVFAINPVNNEKVPVWVADYVLASYGTGAVMAVPAHDERDLEFAKKYKLPVKKVVEPIVVDIKGDSAIVPGKEFVRRNNVCVVLRNPKDGKYLCTNWKNHHMHGLVTGGLDEGEDIVECAKREILEETGFKNIEALDASGQFLEHAKTKYPNFSRASHEPG
jgi:leucyl-tRNA synthetase